MAFPSLPTIDDVLPGVLTQDLVSVTFQIDCSVGTTAFADGQTVDLLQSIADELDTQGAVIINGPASGVRNGPIVTPDDLLESMVDHLAAVDPHPQYQTNAESAAETIPLAWIAAKMTSQMTSLNWIMELSCTKS